MQTIRYSILYVFWWIINGRQFKRCKNRFEMYNYVMEVIGKDNPIDYLEFGVFKGETINYWSELSKNKYSTFTGFDSFDGLPETWNTLGFKRSSGHFDTNGKIPEMGDKRIKFVRGLFQDTVERFLEKTELSNRIIIHIDCDLYSSASFVIGALNNIILPGTILVFDEFYSVTNEFRAFSEYKIKSGKKFKLIATSKWLGKTTFEVL